MGWCHMHSPRHQGVPSTNKHQGMKNDRGKTIKYMFTIWITLGYGKPVWWIKNNKHCGCDWGSPSFGPLDDIVSKTLVWVMSFFPNHCTETDTRYIARAHCIYPSLPPLFGKGFFYYYFISLSGEDSLWRDFPQKSVRKITPLPPDSANSKKQKKHHIV